MMRQTLVLVLFLVGCGDTRPLGDAGPDDGGMVIDDSGSMVVDAGDGTDAGRSDAVVLGDAGIDAGTSAPSCLPGSAYDAPLGVCIQSVLGDVCASGHLLRWGTEEDQVRVQALLPMVGGNGGTALRRPAFGTWQWPDGTSPPPLVWASSPESGHGYSYLTPAGLRSYHRTYTFQVCMTDPMP